MKGDNYSQLFVDGKIKSNPFFVFVLLAPQSLSDKQVKKIIMMPLHTFLLWKQMSLYCILMAVFICKYTNSVFEQSDDGSWNTELRLEE